MTTTTPQAAAAAAASQSPANGPQISSPRSASNSCHSAVKTPQAGNGQQSPGYLFAGSSSPAFQQVKQTQASLARLSRVHNSSQSQSSQQLKESTQVAAATTTTIQQQQIKSTTFVDCLIRRFKDCFSEDFCTVPMFVVGNLSPGSDGTHLILPPCVSLGRQNINRFASPKNARLMNSIRESCRSIEELDLGGNKLNDLIEVYKILQCTPNLKFLNLSENDLSRSAPIAMAATCSSFASTASNNSNLLSSSSSSSSHYASVQNVAAGSPLAATSGGAYQPPGGAGSWSSSAAATGPLNSRNCLAPINQNHQHAIGARRHSTLDQTHPATAASSSRLDGRQTSVRLVETRRLAATTAALAQSKKTSSSVASKLASSAASTAHSRSPLPRRPATSGPALGAGSSSGGGGGAGDASSQSDGDKGPLKSVAAAAAGHSHQQRRQGAAASTMHLARSLSSLSAKDVRGAASVGSSLSRHRLAAVGGGAAAGRKSSNLRGPAAPGSQACRIVARQEMAKQLSGSRSSQSVGELPLKGSDGAKLVVGTNDKQQLLAATKPSSLTNEPIDESDDIDMGEQLASTGSGGSNQEALQVVQAVALPSSQQQQTRALGLQQTGTTLTTTHTATRPSLGAASGAGGPSSSYGGGGQSVNFKRTFESIKALALNNTGCQWRVVCSILNRMPNLEELHLSLNNYERIDLDPNEFRYPSLKRLYLCNNPKLRNWEELDKLLLAFPSLEALSIADCNISQIPDNLDRAREWQKLCGLNINGWPIKEWPVIERLNQLPSLIDLRCRNLEILNTIDEPRDHLIARLPKLQRLNGSEIEEREHAEKSFLRFFMANSHLERPTRFHELVQIHGEIMWPPPVDVDVDLSPPSQAQVRVVHLNRNHYCKENEDDILMSEDFLIKLMDNVEAEPSANNQLAAATAADSMEVGDDTGDNKPVRLFKDEGQEVLAIGVDLRQSVRKFKSTLASLFGLQSQNIILYYIDREMVGLMGPEVIKHNQKKLWNYNVQDGDQFIVEER